MSHELQGWELTEGRIDTTTPDPKVSEIIAALEAIRFDQENPFVILGAPATDDAYASYCQARIREDGYACEIRIFNGKEFRHMLALAPDAKGRVGEDPETRDCYGDGPNLGQVIGIFIAFIANPNAFPTVEGLKWSDMTFEFEQSE